MKKLVGILISLMVFVAIAVGIMQLSAILKWHEDRMVLIVFMWSFSTIGSIVAYNLVYNGFSWITPILMARIIFTIAGLAFTACSYSIFVYLVDRYVNFKSYELQYISVNLIGLIFIIIMFITNRAFFLFVMSVVRIKDKWI